jgi:hypothetical protein
MTCFAAYVKRIQLPRWRLEAQLLTWQKNGDNTTNNLRSRVKIKLTDTPNEVHVIQQKSSVCELLGTFFMIK